MADEKPTVRAALWMHYRAWAIRTPHPAARIAEAAGVPVVTVHRWIREARLRGHLPFAARGKAG